MLYKNKLSSNKKSLSRYSNSKSKIKIINSPSVNQQENQQEKKPDTIIGIKIRRLSDAIPMILKKAIEHNGTTIINFSFGNDSIGSYKEKLNVFGKTGEVCIRCKKSIIVKIFVSQRGTHFCSRCQKK